MSIILKIIEFCTTRYLCAGNQLAQETRNNIKKTYVYEPLSFKPVALVQDNEVYHYHLDHLGTPRELTNDAGDIVWKVRYKSWGNVALKECEDIENNLRFQGQYFDEETGLHYNRHRYYNPDTGQFISQDPIGLLGGVNNYQYAPNPLGWIDPFGLKCEEYDLALGVGIDPDDENKYPLFDFKDALNENNKVVVKDYFDLWDDSFPAGGYSELEENILISMHCAKSIRFNLDVLVTDKNSLHQDVKRVLYNGMLPMGAKVPNQTGEQVGNITNREMYLVFKDNELIEKT